MLPPNGVGGDPVVLVALPLDFPGLLGALNVRLGSVVEWPVGVGAVSLLQDGLGALDEVRA